jgi:NAD(P)H-hydrate epimerase
MIAGLVANGAPAFEAAASAVYVHGRAAAAAGTGPSLVAPDLLDALAPTLGILGSGTDPWEE